MTRSTTMMIPAWLDGRLQPLDKFEVHRRGLRHPAVSVFVHRGGRALLQQRAAGKYHSSLLWANACCTHPWWGEDPAACARRRLVEELGLDGLTLRPAGQVEYRAAVGNGLIEHEEVALFTAELAADRRPAPNPAEVADLCWVDAAGLAAAVAARPAAFAPWLRVYLAGQGAALFGGAVPARPLAAGGDS